jgi:hypothetical protein
MGGHLVPQQSTYEVKWDPGMVVLVVVEDGALALTNMLELGE